MSIDNLSGRTARGAAWVMASSIFTRILDAVLLVVLARLLGPNAFGLVALAAAIIAIAEVFRDMGLQQAAIQRKILTDRHKHSLFWGAQGIALALTTVLLLVSPLLAGLLGEPDVQPVLMFLALSLPMQAVGIVPKALLQRSLRFKPIAMSNVVGNVAGGIAGFSLAFGGYGVYSLVARSLTQILVIDVMVLLASRYVPRASFGRSEFTELFRFGLPVAGSRSLEVIQGRTDDLLIGTFMGAKLLGVYSVAYRLFRILLDTFVGTVSQVVTPAFAKMQEDRQRLLRAYYSAQSITLIVGVAVMAGVASIADELIVVIFGDVWVDAVPVMKVLALLGIMQAGRYYDAALLFALGRPGKTLMLRTITFIPIVIALVAVSPLENLTVFAAVFVVVEWLISMPIWLYALRSIAGVKFREVFRVSYRPLIAGCLMFVTVSSYRELAGTGTATLDLCAEVPLGAAVYIGTLYLIDRSALLKVLATARSIIAH